MKTLIAFLLICCSLSAFGHETSKAQELERKLNCVIRNQEKIKSHLRCTRGCKQRLGGRLTNGGIMSCKVCIEPHLEDCKF